MKRVVDHRLKRGITAGLLVRQMHDAGGFSAKKFGTAAQIVRRMLDDKECTKFLSFPADIVATGTRGVIRDIVKNKHADVVITTCGMLDHDLARVWRDYYHGDFDVDDRKLHQRGINRLGNVFVPNSSYGVILEKKVQPILAQLYAQKKEWSTAELCREFGLRLAGPRAKDSILYWAAKNNVPVVIPGITDGSLGFQLWMFSQDHKDFRINILADEHLLFDLVFQRKRTGALMIGGGISKHHTLWWNQFKRGLDYAVQITTAVEWDGSLSGARLREAVSWGKIKENARHVTVNGDATILLPLLYAAVLEK